MFLNPPSCMEKTGEKNNIKKKTPTAVRNPKLSRPIERVSHAALFLMRRIDDKRCSSARSKSRYKDPGSCMLVVFWCPVSSRALQFISVDKCRNEPSKWWLFCTFFFLSFFSPDFFLWYVWEPQFDYDFDFRPSFLQ